MTFEFSRRGILGVFAATTVAAAPVMANAFGIIRGAGDYRRIRMYSGRTGESIDTVYWVEGKYIRDALNEINIFMRDWRTGQVIGIDPRTGDGGRGYRRRVAGLIAAGRAWARFERGQVVFKAEVGSQSPAVGQIQGVWVHPDWRGRGIGTAGTAALSAAIVGSGRIASLYVNSFNAVARATYARIGFSEVGSFATVLLD